MKAFHLERELFFRQGHGVVNVIDPDDSNMFETIHFIQKFYGSSGAENDRKCNQEKVVD